MTLPIGTEITYQGGRHVIIGYADNLGVIWYKIKPVGSTSIHYNTVSGKYFSDIVEPVPEPEKKCPWLLIGAAIILFYLLTRG